MAPRTEQLFIRLRDDEMEILKLAAGSLHMAVTSYARTMVMQGAYKTLGSKRPAKAAKRTADEITA